MCYYLCEGIIERAKMTQTIINTAVTFVVSSILGYCVSVIRNYKNKIKEKEDRILNEFAKIKESELCDMRSDLASKFFVYDAMEEVEDYLFVSWQEKCNRYFELGGDAYVHQLYEKSNKWKIKQTGYLK